MPKRKSKKWHPVNGHTYQFGKWHESNGKDTIYTFKVTRYLTHIRTVYFWYSFIIPSNGSVARYWYKMVFTDGDPILYDKTTVHGHKKRKTTNWRLMANTPNGDWNISEPRPQLIDRVKTAIVEAELFHSTESNKR